MITRIWQHIASGERFAVAVDSFNQVVGATGPLHHSEIAVAKEGNWDADWDVTSDIKADTNSYRDVTNRVEHE